MAQTVKMKMVTNWYQQETSSAILTSTAEFMDIWTYQCVRYKVSSIAQV